jgi:uncharacterized protein YdaU (DUF1376 family)
MAEYPALPLWTDAYLSDTGHLTTIEHGAYLLLLMTMWRAGGRLPLDDKKRARFARMTSLQWERIKPTMMEFFTVEGDEIRQGRLTDELAFVRQHSAKQSNNARAKSRKYKEAEAAMAVPKRSQTSAPTPKKDIDTSLRSVSSEPSQFDELSKVLDPLHAKAVIDHKKGFRGKFTPHAASLLAKEFARCPDPNAGADAMIANGWQGFKAEWLDRRSNTGGGNQPRETTIERRMRELRERVADEHRSEREGEPDPDALDGLPLLSGPHN